MIRLLPCNGAGQGPVAFDPGAEALAGRMLIGLDLESIGLDLTIQAAALIWIASVLKAYPPHERGEVLMRLGDLAARHWNGAP